MESTESTKADVKSDSDLTDEQPVPINLSDIDLSPEQKAQVEALLRKYADAFASTKYELGTATGVKHTIELSDSHPFKDRQLTTKKFENISKKCWLVVPSENQRALGVQMLSLQGNRMDL